MLAFILGTACKAMAQSAAPSLDGSPTTQSCTSCSSLSVTLPSMSNPSGDFIVLEVATYLTNYTGTLPSGFLLIAPSPKPNPYTWLLRVFGHVYQAGDPTTVTFSLPSNAYAISVIAAAYKGVSSITPVDGGIGAGQVSQTATTTLLAPSITLSQPNDTLLTFYEAYGAVNFTYPTPPNSSSPCDFTKGACIEGPATQNGTVFSATFADNALGAVQGSQPSGNQSITTSASTNRWLAIQLALEAAPTTSSLISLDQPAATTAYNSTAVTSVTLNFPSDVASNDICLAEFSPSNTAGTVAAVPSAWTFIRRDVSGTGGAEAALYWYRSLGGGNDPSTFAWTLSSVNATYVGWIQCFSGVNTSSPIDPNNSTGVGATSSGATSLAVPAFASSFAQSGEELILNCIVRKGSDLLWSGETAPYSQFTQFVGSAGDGLASNIYVNDVGFYSNVQSTGAPGAQACNQSTTIAYPMVGEQIALQPAPTPTPTPTATATTTATATATATSTATVTATLAATPTATVTATATNTPIQGATGTPVATATPNRTYPTGVSKHIGFDQYVVGVKADMETWWKDSPYFDVAFYLNGGYRGINPATGKIPFDYNLDADWIATVSNEGWGLIPIWSDQQAPCNSQFGWKFPWTTADAYAAGLNEAQAAILSAETLGLSSSMIYLDVEQYSLTATDPSDNSLTCGAAAQQFMLGWINGLHAAGFQAGVYGSPIDAQHDVTNGLGWADASPLPDDVWLSYIPSLHHDTVTVWSLNGLGYNLSDSLWNNNQRLVQYTGTPCCTESWGGVNFGQTLNGSPSKIDKDIENGSIVVGNGIKTYTFTEQPPFQAAGGAGSSPSPLVGGPFPPSIGTAACSPGLPLNGCTCPANECQIAGTVYCTPDALAFYSGNPSNCYNYPGLGSVFDVQLARAQCDAVYDWGLEGGGTVTGTLVDYVNAWASGDQGGCELDGTGVCPLFWGELCANPYGPAPTAFDICPPEYSDPSMNDVFAGQDPYDDPPYCYWGIPPECPTGSIYVPLLENCLPLTTPPIITAPNGISGISDVTFGGSLPSGEMGEVVGYYSDSNGFDHGFVYNPNATGSLFSNSGEALYPVDCTYGPQNTVALNTQLAGVNNKGIAVGTYQDTANNSYAFTYDINSGGGSCQPLSNCSQCVAMGINDAGWIVGYQYQGAVTFGRYQGFVY